MKKNLRNKMWRIINKDEGESNGSIISSPTAANVEGQKDKADADAKAEEDSEKSDD